MTRGAHALEDPRDDELRHVMSEATHERSCNKADERNEEDHPRPDSIAQPSEDREQDRTRERVADHHPAHVLEGSKFAGHSGQ